jgi:hypothetical protein
MTKLATGFLLLLVLLFLPNGAAAQKQKTVSPVPANLTRTTTRTETGRLGFGGTLTVIGAPEGSIIIEGWSRSEVEVRAEIQLHANSEQDLDRLAAVNGFALDEDLNHIRVLTVGTHDRAYMKAKAKNFPKGLLALPWRIDYHIRVPEDVDLDINGGNGPISVMAVEGNVRISAPHGDVKLEFSGGTVSATVGAGTVDMKVTNRSWRGVGADLKVAAGAVTIEFPGGFNGDLDADILRQGEIENGYDGLEAREKPGITKQQIKGRMGSGGAFFLVTVGDGRIYIRKSESEE